MVSYVCIAEPLPLVGVDDVGEDLGPGEVRHADVQPTHTVLTLEQVRVLNTAINQSINQSIN